MKKLWNDWSGPVAFTLGWTLLLAAALLVPNVPVWAGDGSLVELTKCPDAQCDNGCKFCTVVPADPGSGKTHACQAPPPPNPPAPPITCDCFTGGTACAGCACKVTFQGGGLKCLCVN